jgi:hypothetical protein
VSLSFRHRRLAPNKNIPHEVPGKSSLIISAKLVGVGAASQRLIPTGERSGLRTPFVTTASVSLCVPDEKLRAFLELEAVISQLARLGEQSRR